MRLLYAQPIRSLYLRRSLVIEAGLESGQDLQCTRVPSVGAKAEDVVLHEREERVLRVIFWLFSRSA